jgi:TrmH family RNA methyltransferase
MISKNQIKYLKSLHLKKQRQKYNIFIAEGDKIAKELISSAKYSVQAVYALNNWLMQNSTLLKNINTVYQLSERELQAISLLKTPNQVLIVAEKLEERVNYSLISLSNVIYLDDVQDPGNMGTIIRIADWFGISTVIRSRKSADFYNPKLIQASMGSFLRVNLFTESFDVLHSGLKNHATLVADMNGENAFESEYTFPAIVVFGNEGLGVSENVISKANKIIRIPGADTSNRAESLNVAVSAGVICSILFKKQKP